METAAAFLGISALVIVTPGQDTVLTIRNTLLGGRAGGTFTAVGVAFGQAIWILAASAGVTALLLASEPAFAAIRLVGAAFLVYLGVQALIAAARGGATSAMVAGRAGGLSRAVALRQGLFSNLGNPKMAVFFTSLLPQFGSSFVGLAALGLLFCSLTLMWLSLYAVVVSRAGNLLRRGGIRRALEALTGAALVALGLRLAAER
jgi:threonine/homoserine/homoserine lactone efflux protein